MATRPSGPVATRCGASTRTTSQWSGAQPSEACTSSAVGKASVPCQLHGGAEPWSTTSSIPPGATVPAARRRTATRSQSTGDCRKQALMRSNGPSGMDSARSRCSVATSTPAAAAARVRARALGATSTAVVAQPCDASQTASRPSPQPRSRARPGYQGPGELHEERVSSPAPVHAALAVEALPALLGAR